MNKDSYSYSYYYYYIYIYIFFTIDTYYIIKCNAGWVYKIISHELIHVIKTYLSWSSLCIPFTYLNASLMFIDHISQAMRYVYRSH